MDLQKTVRQAQLLTNEAGLDFNSMKPKEAENRLIELKKFLNDMIQDPEPEKQVEPEKAQETEDPEKEEEVEEEVKEPGPEAQPSDE